MLSSDTIFGRKDKLPVTPPVLQPNKSGVLQQGARGMSSMYGGNDAGSQLIVGPNIKLKGVEINDCDTLVVEGRVEATMDSRIIRIAENGIFKGAANIDVAEIRGEFCGDLTVRERLVIHHSGKVSGKIRYGCLVIEEGGQLNGDIQQQEAQKKLQVHDGGSVTELKTA